MTPTQLRSFATVVRVGSVRAAARELGVTEAAVSGNVGALRRELDDRLFSRNGDGLVFTPGGLRLAYRASEILGLQEQTRREVELARDGRRLLRIAATSLFAEYAAPGLIELFSTRAADLDVELIVESSLRFDALLSSHEADVAIGPKASRVRPDLVEEEFLRYEVIAVRSPGTMTDPDTWRLGPSAVEPAGVSQFILQRAGVSERQQRIYPSHSAAIEEAKRGHGIALVPAFAAAADIETGSLVQVEGRMYTASSVWTVATLPVDRASPAALELTRFVRTPRAIQAMLSGSGSGIDRFKPRVHITLWS